MNAKYLFELLVPLLEDDGIEKFKVGITNDIDTREKQYMTMQVMNGFCLSLCRCEFARFLSKDKSETLSSDMYATHFRITIQR